MRSIPPIRRAFSLVEVLVTLGIIAVLIALLLPAIQKVRQSALRVQCQSNLRQAALSLHTFHDSFKYFPQGITTHPPPVIFNVPSSVWTIDVLPYLEQGSLQRSIDHSLPYMTPPYVTANMAALKKPILALQCPADLQSQADIPGLGLSGMARINYVACFSADGVEVEPSAPQDVDNCNNDPLLNPSVSSGKRALFNVNVRRSLSSLSDGASNTVALSEVITAPSGSQDLRGLWWSHFGMQYTHMHTPNSTVPDALFDPYCDSTRAPCQPASPCLTTLIVTARSLHWGGVNSARADGSVYFVSDRIDLGTWQALASINGGEPISE